MDAGRCRRSSEPARSSGDDRLTLVGVESIDDFATAAVTEIRTVGGWESGVGNVTYVGVAADPYPGDAICFDGTIEPGGGRCFDNVAISADGDLLAYTVPVAGGAGIVRRVDLVVVGVGDGAERARITLREHEPFSVGPLDILGDLMVVGSDTRGSEGSPVLVDVALGTVTSLDAGGVAGFAFTLTDG